MSEGKSGYSQRFARALNTINERVHRLSKRDLWIITGLGFLFGAPLGVAGAQAFFEYLADKGGF